MAGCNKEQELNGFRFQVSHRLNDVTVQLVHASTSVIVDFRMDAVMLEGRALLLDGCSYRPSMHYFAWLAKTAYLRSIVSLQEFYTTKARVPEVRAITKHSLRSSDR